MTLADVENLTAAELKAKRSEIVKSIEGEKVPVEDLITRYLQARLDAKVRDEKLAEQGKAITILQQELEAATEKATVWEDRESYCRQEAKKSVDQLETKITALEKVVADARTANSQLTTALKEAQTLAKARRKALADVAGVINPLLVQE